MKIDWITFWISALACYRVTILIARDFGPLEIFKRMRSIPRYSKLLKCPFCVSIYVGSATAFLLWLGGYVEPWPMWICLSLSFSAVTIAADRVFTSDYNT